MCVGREGGNREGVTASHWRGNPSRDSVVISWPVCGREDKHTVCGAVLVDLMSKQELPGISVPDD